MSVMNRARLIAVVAAMAVSACGGGGSSSDPTATPAPVVTPKATISTQVIDGPIKGALVCLDKNLNGLCDNDEPRATTDTQGNVSFQVDAADVGKYPLVAYVGTDAVDTVNGPVTVPFLMSTPADATSVITPFTTIVQQTVVSSGATTAQAVQSVQTATGISANLFVDPSALGGSAQAIARLIVLTAQQVTTTMSGAVGAAALNNTPITQQSVFQVAKSQTLLLLPQIVASITSGQSDAALAQAASTVVSAANLTVDSAKLLVAGQNAPPDLNSIFGVVTNTFRTLNYTDSSNYFARFYTTTAAQSTPDAQGKTDLIDRKIRVSNGFVSKWGGTSPASPSQSNNTYFNGTQWRQCGINGPFQSVWSTLATGELKSVYDFCDQNDVGVSISRSVDISGQSMLSVYKIAISAGGSNLSVDNPVASFGNATFPTGSVYRFVTTTPTFRAFAYYNAPSNQISEPTRAGCSGPSTSQVSTSLESLVNRFNISPCSYANSDSFFYNGVTYTEPVVTVYPYYLYVAKIGNSPTGTGVAPGYYSGNTLIRVGFNDPVAKTLTYYQCKEKFLDGSARACVPIQDGTYSIETRGDARVLILKNLPATVATASSYVVPVERGGYVYYGFITNAATYLQGRFNTVATAAVAAQLGIALEDPAVPLALTAGSYQGTYRLFDLSGKYVRVVFNANGTVSCSNAPTASGTLVASTSCSFTINDPAFGSATTGKFTLVNTATSVAVTTVGTIDFMSGVIASTSSTDSASWSGYRQ